MKILKRPLFSSACRLEKSISAVHGGKMAADTKKGSAKIANPLISLVGGTGIEPVTSTV